MRCKSVPMGITHCSNPKVVSSVDCLSSPLSLGMIETRGFPKLRAKAVP